MFGRQHSDKSKKKMSDPPFFFPHPKKVWIFGSASDLKKGKPRAEGTGRPSQQISVTDNQNNTITIYDSMSAASIALNIDKRRISDYFIRNQENPYKGRYTFKKL